MAVLLTGASVPQTVNFVNYIQTNGSQYFDTGFKPNQNTRIVMDAQFTAATSQSVLYTPFGVRAGGYFFELYKASTSNWNLTFLWNTTYSQYFSIDYSARHTFEINKNVATVDGTSKTYTAGTFQLAYPMFLSATNNTGVAESVTALRIYSCQIYDNGTLVRDYLPCLDKDGVACLYDQVNEEYVYHSGSGELTAA